MAGWLIGFDAILGIFPHMVTMKFTTALMFTVSGIGIYARTNYDARNSTATTCGFVILGVLFFLSYDLWIGGKVQSFEGDDAVMTIAPGLPSAGTMGCFFGMASMLILHNDTVWRSISRIISVVAAVALAGYALDMPALYYYSENLSTAMAIHTAGLFLMLSMFSMATATTDEIVVHNRRWSDNRDA